MFIFILFFIGVIIAERQRPAEKIRDAERHSRRTVWLCWVPYLVSGGPRLALPSCQHAIVKWMLHLTAGSWPKLVKHVTGSIRPPGLGSFAVCRKVKVHQVAIKVAHRIISAHQGKIEAEQKIRHDRSNQRPRAPDDGICDGPDECDWISTEAVEWKLSCTVQWALVTFFMAMTLISCPDLGLILNSFFFLPLKTKHKEFLPLRTAGGHHSIRLLFPSIKYLPAVNVFNLRVSHSSCE